MKKIKIITLVLVMIFELSLIGCNQKIIEPNTISNLQEVTNSAINTQELTNATNDLQEKTDSVSDLQEESDQIGNIAQDIIGENPILIIVNNSLIGAYKENEWVDYGDVFENNVQSIDFSIYSIDKRLGSGKILNTETYDVTYPLPFIEIIGFENYPKDFIALSSNEKALKRISATDDKKKHYEILASTLQKQGLDIPMPNVIESISIDLDGDGNEELFTIGSAYDESDCIDEWLYKANNNYSIVIYSKNENGSYTSTIMDESSRSTIYHSSTLDELNISKDTLVIREIHYSMIGCLDIDNDNKMEVVIKRESIDGADYQIYKFTNGNFEMVLSYFYGYG